MNSKAQKNVDMRRINTKAIPPSTGPYSQAIVVNSNQILVFVSGQLPIHPKTGQLIKGDIKVLTKQTLDNIEAILIASASNMYSVIRTEVFLKDFKTDFQGMNEEYSKRFNPDLPPTRQTIQVVELPMGSPIEISCIAICNSKINSSEGGSRKTS